MGRFAGSLTPVFTVARRNLNYHGWLDLSCFGRAKFTDGTIVAFEPEPVKERGFDLFHHPNLAIPADFDELPEA